MFKKHHFRNSKLKTNWVSTSRGLVWLLQKQIYLLFTYNTENLTFYLNLQNIFCFVTCNRFKEEYGCFAFTTIIFNSNSFCCDWCDGFSLGDEVSKFCVVWTNGGTVLHAHHSHVESEQLLAGWFSFRPISEAVIKEGERHKRGETSSLEVTICSDSTPIPKQWGKYISNPWNKFLMLRAL